ncbi:GntR family transcriptional regulator [Nonomuraea sp. bgisy101]|uniref:winged helix-turn-helix domain-containing protein n=1 Tax=Nonomuraea sp. bgisy101 TaxID=3413784 RepID=UPI003D75E9C9
MYRQIADSLRERIASGALCGGDAVPSETMLQTEFGVARATARRVAQQLREWGLAHTVQGEGTFVGEPGVPHKRRNLPLYEAIAVEVARRIRSGELRPNTSIPSEKQLMRQFGVAKVTAREAVARLREQGMVFTVPYRGSYVSPAESWPPPDGGAGASEAQPPVVRGRDDVDSISPRHARQRPV